jgi:nitronate monooxygenase
MAEGFMQTTRLADLLGCELPIIQGAIGYATCPALAATVSKAGGPGTLAHTGRGLNGLQRLLVTRRP